MTLASGEAIACGTLVNAAGTGAGRLAAMAGIELPVGPRKRYVYVLDCPQATEALRHKVFLNEVQQTLTFTNIGTGGVPITLRTALTAATIGAYVQNDTGNAFDGVIGPKVYVFNDVLTTAEGAALMGYKTPT